MPRHDGPASVLDAAGVAKYPGFMKTGLQWLGVLWLVMGMAMARETPGEDRKVEGIAYHAADKKVEDPEKRCVLDLRIPGKAKGFPTLVWFHGGGLTGGNREFPKFDGRGVALVAAGYRLSPQAKCPEFIEDAAAAVAWTLAHIAEYGGDPEQVFVGGHSAGGYLALMIGMDPKWLAAHSVSNRRLAGLIPVSAQVTTHFHVKELRGHKADRLVPVIDEFAPLHFVSKDLPPICLITGDRRIEWPCRVEENELFHATLRQLGHPAAEFHEIKDLDHGTVPRGAARILPDFIQRTTQRPKPGP